MARGWYVAGCPASAVTPILGSFEDWCRSVGGVLAYSGVNGFLQNLKEMHEAADPSQGQWAAFLSALYRVFQARSFTVRELVPLFAEGNELTNTLPDELCNPQKDRSRTLGNAFQRNRGRRYGDEDLHVEMDGTAQGGVVRWKIEQGRRVGA
jgi:hypothetical protein